MKSISLVLACLFSIEFAICQDNPNFIPHYPTSITVDGNLSEEVWDNIIPHTNFYNQFPIDSGYAKNLTEVKIFHNQEFLYIGVVYHDTNEQNNISSLKRDVYNEVMVLSDCFGIILDTYTSGDNGYFFGINASGVQYDALVGNINDLNDSWNTIWYGEVKKYGSKKYYELAIPIDALNFNYNNNTWGIQCFLNDTKLNQFSTLVKSSRNFTQQDLRFTKKLRIENLPNKTSRKFAVTPSQAYVNFNNVLTNESNGKFTTSLNAQYNITSSLRLDAAINPDFSQVEVDQQVTNLTRYAINFPERRPFFLENSDLFNNLGTSLNNPFYSRKIGSSSDVLVGLKLSGNISKKTRIGLLSVRSKAENNIMGRTSSILVARQNISNSLIASTFLVNNSHKNHFNRIAGANINFKSDNNKWISSLNYGKAFTKNVIGENDFLNIEAVFQTRKFTFETSYQKTGKNYIAETGFVPLLDNYDAITGRTTREGYQRLNAEVEIKRFHNGSQILDWSRVFLLRNTAIIGQDGNVRENRIFFSPYSVRFRNRSYAYVSFNSTIEDLKFNFDVFRNGNYISPGDYNYTFGRLGYWSPTNRKVYYTLRFEYGQYYLGKRINQAISVTYRLLPRAVLSLSYSRNNIDLGEIGRKTLHLGNFKSEIYFSNRLNWTTYLQYNTQQDNFNINSRMQWEYKPLSYVYLVLTDNLDGDWKQKNYGISFKINRRFDF